ncbi:MAG TPA: hypothetical protein PKW90_03730, partial [Myxococcota bacterium]|nr:hypothetical protein [Myxococcota bacterium]
TIRAGGYEVQILTEDGGKWSWYIPSAGRSSGWDRWDSEGRAMREGQKAAWRLGRERRVAEGHADGLVRKLLPQQKAIIYSPAWLASRVLSKTARLVLVALTMTVPRNPVEGERYNQISYSSIGAHAGCSKRAAIDAVREIMDAGLVDKRIIIGRDGYEPNLYTIIDPPEYLVPALPEVPEGPSLAPRVAEEEESKEPKEPTAAKKRNTRQVSEEARALVRWAYAPKTGGFTGWAIRKDWNWAERLIQEYGSEGATARIVAAHQTWMARKNAERPRHLIAMKGLVEEAAQLPLPEVAAAPPELRLEDLEPLEDQHGAWDAWMALMEARIGRAGWSLFVDVPDLQPHLLSADGVILSVRSKDAKAFIEANSVVEGMACGWAEILGAPVPMEIRVRS